MNLNNPSALFLKFRLPETTVPGFLLPRTKPEKQAMLKRCKEEGKEENLNAICSHCELVRRKCAKKDPANPHYGCTKKCCLMLHYWDMCTYCIEERHPKAPVVEDSEKRHAEVVKFQRVFSKLPEDVQRYISEYVPQVFTFVRSFGELLRGNRLGPIERHLKLPKSVWSQVQNVLIDRCAGFGLTSRSTRKQICERMKDIYKRMYNAQCQQITEIDFWSHKPWSGVFYNMKLVNTLKAVHNILPN